jgi:hypothetical protein
MWPFKKKAIVTDADKPASSYVLAKEDGVVESIMFDHIVIGGRKYACRAPLVEGGSHVKKNQPVGKK